MSTQDRKILPSTPLFHGSINSTHHPKKKKEKPCCDPRGSLVRLFVLIAPSFFFFSIFATDDIVVSAVPTLRQTLDLQSSAISILYSATPAVSMFTTILFGFGLQYLGIRLVTVLASASILGGTLLFIYAPTFWGKVLGRALFGVGVGPLEILAELIFLRWFDDSEDIEDNNIITTELAFGVLASAGMLGSIVAYNFVPFILNYFHNSLIPAFTVVALIPTLSFVLAIGFFVIDYWATPLLDLDEKEEEEQGFLEAMRTLSWSFWVLVVMTGTTWSMIYIMLIYMTDYLHEKWEYDNLQAGHFTSVTFAIAIVVSPIVGMIISKKGQVITLLVLASILLTGTSLFFGLCSTDYHPLIGLSGIGLSVAVFEPTLYTAIAAVIPESAETVGFSLNSLVFQVMLCVVPIGVGYLNDYLGSYDIVTYMMASLAGLSVFLSLLLGYLEPSLQSAGKSSQVKLFYRPVVVSRYSRHHQKLSKRRRARSLDAADFSELRNSIANRPSDFSGGEEPINFDLPSDSKRYQKHHLEDVYKSVSVPPSFWSAIKDTEVQVIPVQIDEEAESDMFDVFPGQSEKKPKFKEIWDHNPIGSSKRKKNPAGSP